MRPRTKRNLAAVAGIGIGLLGVALLAFALLWDQPDGQLLTSDFDEPNEVRSQQDVDLSGLMPLLKLRLQRPLVDPVKVVKKPIKIPKKVVSKPWPKFKLSCIFMGNNADLAVFELDQKSHSCVEGDTFGQVKVVEIDAQSVTVEFSGESRVVRLPVKEQGASQ